MWHEGEEEKALLAEARVAMGIDDSAKGEDDGLEDTFLQVSERGSHFTSNNVLKYPHPKTPEHIRQGRCRERGLLLLPLGVRAVPAHGIGRDDDSGRRHGDGADGAADGGGAPAPGDQEARGETATEGSHQTRLYQMLQVAQLNLT